IHIALITWILRVSKNSSLIDNEIAEMHHSMRIIDREPRHICIYLVRDCADRERMI
ncbi:hypothetical protein BDDG_13362, partial [Blastomyces dermatitidis ATCC 18188]